LYLTIFREKKTLYILYFGFLKPESGKFRNLFPGSGAGVHDDMGIATFLSNCCVAHTREKTGL
jgi:hypothetical protein